MYYPSSFGDSQQLKLSPDEDSPRGRRSWPNMRLCGTETAAIYGADT